MFVSKDKIADRMMEPDEGEISERKQNMISNHKIQTALDEIKDISRIDLALYTEKGKPVAATFEPEGDLEGAITSFADSMAESQMLSGYHFFKVIVDGEVEYILLTKSQAEDAYGSIYDSMALSILSRLCL